MAGLHASLASQIASRGDAIVRVAVDGVSGACKTSFADALATVMHSADRATIRATADDFHRPKLQRYRLGRDSPNGHFLESYDYVAMKRELLEPLSPDGSRRYRTAVFDCALDRAVMSPVCISPAAAILIDDGLFLQRDELRHHWDVSIFLEVPFEIATRRCAQRDGTVADFRHPSNRRYVEGETRYLQECRPRDRASIVIDNSDFSRPVRVRWPRLSTRLRRAVRLRRRLCERLPRSSDPGSRAPPSALVRLVRVCRSDRSTGTPCPV
jgi:uridine kinase